MTVTTGLQLLLDESEPRLTTRADHEEYRHLEHLLVQVKALGAEEIARLSRFLEKHNLMLSMVDAFDSLADALATAQPIHNPAARKGVRP